MKVKIKKNWERTKAVDVKIEPHDTWSLDSALAHIILPALLQLKENKMGVPSSVVKDVGGEDYVEQCSFDFYKESHDWAFDEAVKKWDEILDKMIWSFQQIVLEEYDELYHHGQAKYDFVKTDKQFPNPISGKMEDTYQMVKKNPKEHWYDHVGHMLHEKRIQEGLELFGKYYRDLWE